MSEEIPQTADDAVRGWLVAAGFTCVLIGGELILLHSATIGGIAVLVASAPFYWAAYRWLWLKTRIDAHLVKTISAVATDARWWFGALFVILIALIFSPFIEQRRWPFSTPTSVAELAPKSAAAPALVQPQSAPDLRLIPPAVDISGDLSILSNEEVRAAAYVMEPRTTDYARSCLTKSEDIDRNKSFSDAERGALKIQVDAVCTKEFRAKFLPALLKLQIELQRRLKLERDFSAVEFSSSGTLRPGAMIVAASHLVDLARQLP